MGIKKKQILDPRRTNVVIFLENVVEGVHIRFAERNRLKNS
ncbi:MAG: hypothetical protein WAP47_19935 [Candidatus Rokuibacteriota bacterium]